MSRMFDLVTVINLKRRKDRYATLMNNWPSLLPQPHLIEATDGRDGLAPPHANNITKAQWGCIDSHRRALGFAARTLEEHQTVLVLEDDAIFADDFNDRLESFLNAIPETWGAVMLGGEHVRDAMRISEGVDRSILTNRTHAYALRQPLAQALEYSLRLQGSPLPNATARFFGQLETFCPRPWLVGQHSGWSDIAEKREREGWWNAD